MLEWTEVDSERDVMLLAAVEAARKSRPPGDRAGGIKTAPDRPAGLPTSSNLVGRIPVVDPCVHEAAAAQRPGSRSRRAFLAEMLVVLPVIGISAFELPTADQVPGPELFLKGKGARGEGRETSQGYQGPCWFGGASGGGRIDSRVDS